MKISKLVVAPLLAAIAFSMSACDTSAHSEGNSKSVSVSDDSTSSTTSQPDDAGSSGMGMTYTGKMGIDMGGGLVMPIGGGTPQLGIGF